MRNAINGTERERAGRRTGAVRGRRPNPYQIPFLMFFVLPEGEPVPSSAGAQILNHIYI